jgi:hypothetical protein
MLTPAMAARPTAAAAMIPIMAPEPPPFFFLVGRSSSSSSSSSRRFFVAPLAVVDFLSPFLPGLVLSLFSSSSSSAAAALVFVALLVSAFAGADFAGVCSSSSDIASSA